MEPSKILLVNMGSLSPYPFDPGHFAGSPIVDYPKGFTEALIDQFLDGLDVVWSAETPYSYDVLKRSEERNVRTVIHANYEFAGWLRDPEIPRPDVFLLPSSWHAEDFIRGMRGTPTLLCPFPVAVDRLPVRARTFEDGLLHIAGHRAAADRNGSEIVIEALRRLYRPVRALIRSQSEIPVLPVVPGRAQVETRIENTLNYHEMYDQGQILLAPRRYGGLSLPMNEAMAAGLAVLSLNIAPQRSWLPPEALIPATVVRHLRVQSGHIEVYDADPRELTNRIIECLDTPELLEAITRACGARARALSWSVQTPLYRAMLESIVAGRPAFEPNIAP